MSRHRPIVAAVLSAVLAFTMLGAAPVALAQPEDAPGDGQADEDHHVLIFTATDAGPWHDPAIEEAVPILQDAFEEVGISSEETDDSSIFNDEDLERFDALVMFQTNGDPWSDDEKAAMEAFQQDNGGIAAIHNAADMRGGYDWWDDLIGSLMPSHAATSPPLGLEATVQVEDNVHPSTAHLDQPDWVRHDEWYNFSTNVRGDAHVLLTLDETTYDPGGDAMGYDHPISWCKPYDGGRAWVTAMGHFPEHYEEPDFVQHIVGGVQWAAGQVEGDCGGTVWDEYDKVPLDQNTLAPFALDVAPDGRVFLSELEEGQIRVYNPETQNTTTALDIDIYRDGEDGMLGLALDPDFEENGWIYQYYSPPSDEDVYVNRLSRFTVGEGSIIDPDSEVVIIDVPKQRFDQPGHTGGDVEFDNDGSILLSTGDDVNPHSEPSPRSAPLSTIEGTFHDARETSSNTNDLRGKLLRITPEPDGGYSIPEGNLFPADEYDEDLTRPEIYAMGFRNPFRFTVDPHTGYIGLADYGPDCNSDGECGDYGPQGMVSWSLIKEPGNYGWPLCHGDARPYRDVDYTTDPRTYGDLSDCDNPVNDSPRNTGLEELPPVVAADLVYGYDMSTVPEVIPAGGGLAPMGGPFYEFDPDNEADTKFPAYYDGKPFFYEWSKNDVYSLFLDYDAPVSEALVKINPFLPATTWQAPMDMTFGTDGSLYVLEWGGGFSPPNPNSGLYRVDYTGARTPVASIDAHPTSGQSPLEVSFSSARSYDPDGTELEFAWDFTDDGEVDSTEPETTHTYTEDGVYTARLTVTNEAGMTGTTTTTITVGNTAPEVSFDWPPSGAFFSFGDEISWEVNVTDEEDEEIDPGDVEVQPGLGHDDHTHFADTRTGFTGSVQTSLMGHGEDQNIYYVLGARYTDQGTDTAPPLTGTATAVLQPKRKQAEHHVGAEGVSLVGANDIETGVQALANLGDGAWATYDPVNFYNIDELTFRVASGAEGGAIELRQDAPDGELLGTVEVPDTGGTTSWADVTIPAPETEETMGLYLVFTGDADFRFNFFDAVGQGVSPETRPQVTLTEPEHGSIYDSGDDIDLAAEASDAAHDIDVVEFFAGDELIGEDDTAPYTATFEDAPDGTHLLRARATNSEGLSSYSRYVQVQVGDEVVRPPFVTFSNVDADFRQLGESSFAIEAGGANVWQGTDEYGSIYLPGAAGDEFTVTVQVADHDYPNSSSKAGLIVRNDIASPGEAGGYFLVHRQGNSNFEALYDTNGDGTPDSADSMSGGSTPQWVRIQRDGDNFTGYGSMDGENWEQFSDIEIPDAADTVDVGMFVTAHHSSASAEAIFEDFELELREPDDPDAPQVTAEASPTEGEAPLEVSFSGEATSPVDADIVDYTWDLGDDTVVGGPDATHTYEEPGHYTAVLTATDDEGREGSDSVGITVEDPEPAPELVCRGARSDDFSGDEIDTDRWTTVRGAEGDEPRISDGALVLPVTEGDINEANTGPISFVGQDLPDGEWEATAEVTIEHTREWQHVGLMQHVDDDNYIKFAFTHSSGGDRFFEFQTETDGSREWHFNNENVSGDFPTTVHLRWTSDGEELTSAYSTDGEDWTTFDDAAPLLDGGTLGIVAAGDTDSPGIDALVHSFEFSPDEVDGAPEPSDDFTGDELDGCRWDRVVRYAPEHVSLSDGQLHIDTQEGDIHGGDNTDPPNLVLQSAPEGDWTIETRVDAPLLDNWQHAGLMAYVDDGNYVKFDVVADNEDGTDPELRVELRSEVDDVMLGGPDLEPAPDNDDDTWWLRLTKSGDTYSGSVSTDGEEWVDMPESVENDALGEDAAFGLIAMGPQQSESITVSFDYFELLDEEPVEPPVVSADLDPSEADGEDGWYVSPVTVALSADDADAAIEYRVGDGDWAAYDAAFTLSEDGVHAVEYRASNEGGESEPGTLEVAIDQTPPETDATLDQEGSGPVTVTLDASDETSGVATTEYRFNGGDAVGYEEAFTVDEDGDYTLEFRSVDVAGNVEDWRSVEFTIDTDPAVECDGTIHIGDVDTGVTDRDAGEGACVSDRIDDDRDWRTRGRFIAHVTDVARALRDAGVIDNRERADLVRAASQSGVGGR